MELLKFCEITDASSFRKWAVKNHPDKGCDHDKFVMVKQAYEKYIQDIAKNSIVSAHASFPQSSAASGQPPPSKPTTAFKYPAPPATWNDFFGPPKSKPNQCAAMVDKGHSINDSFHNNQRRRCELTVKKGLKYCRIHCYMDPTSGDKQCIYQKDEKQCKGVAKSGSTHCDRHLKTENIN